LKYWLEIEPGAAFAISEVFPMTFITSNILKTFGRPRLTIARLFAALAMINFTI
jgi:hypothetical protein